MYLKSLLLIISIIAGGMVLLACDKASEAAPPHIATQTPPADDDMDGLSNAEEQWLAETFVPRYSFDNEEHNFFEQRPLQEWQDVVFLYQASPVHCDTLNRRIMASPADGVLLTIVATYTYDYLPLDLAIATEEQDVMGHYGDTERIALCFLRQTDLMQAPSNSQYAEFQIGDETIRYELNFVEVNRHSSITPYLASALEWESESRFVLYVSEGKHASYISYAECMDYPAKYDPQRLVWAEDCTPKSQAVHSIIPKILMNVGEKAAPQFLSIHELTHPENGLEAKQIFTQQDEMIWGEQPFCGGYQVENPFGMQTVSEFVFDGMGFAPWCASSLYSKWWH